jgi:hypothetical protein
MPRFSNIDVLQIATPGGRNAMLDPRANDETSATTEGTDSPGTSTPVSDDYLDEEEYESFPASDPHSDWAGPAS